MASASEIVRAALFGSDPNAGVQCIRLPWPYVAAFKQYADPELKAAFDRLDKLLNSPHVAPVLLPPAAGRAALELLFLDGESARARALDSILFAWLEWLVQAHPDQLSAGIGLWPSAFPLTDLALRTLAQRGNLDGSQLQALAGSRQADSSALARALRVCGTPSAPRGGPLASDVALALARLGDQLDVTADFFDLWCAARAGELPRGTAATGSFWGIAAGVRRALCTSKSSAVSPLALAAEPAAPPEHRPGALLRDISGVPTPSGFRWRCIPGSWAARLKTARAGRWPPPYHRWQLPRWWIGVGGDAVTNRWHLAPRFIAWLDGVIGEPTLERIWSCFDPPHFSTPTYPAGGPGSPDQKDAAVLFCLHHPPPEDMDCVPNLIRLLRAIHRAWPITSCLRLREIMKLGASVRWSSAPRELVLLCLEASLTRLPGRLVGLRERLASLRAAETGGRMARKVDRHLRQALAHCD